MVQNQNVVQVRAFKKLTIYAEGDVLGRNMIVYTSAYEDKLNFGIFSIIL